MTYTELHEAIDITRKLIGQAYEACPEHHDVADFNTRIAIRGLKTQLQGLVDTLFALEGDLYTRKLPEERD